MTPQVGAVVIPRAPLTPAQGVSLIHAAATLLGVPVPQVDSSDDDVFLNNAVVLVGIESNRRITILSTQQAQPEPAPVVYEIVKALSFECYLEWNLWRVEDVSNVPVIDAFRQSISAYTGVAEFANGRLSGTLSARLPDRNVYMSFKQHLLQQTSLVFLTLDRVALVANLPRDLPGFISVALAEWRSLIEVAPGWKENKSDIRTQPAG